MDTVQSSIEDSSVSSLGVDGVSVGDDISCTRTATEKNPWWRVDLGRTTDVEKVVFWSNGQGSNIVFSIGDYDQPSYSSSDVHFDKNYMCKVNGSSVVSVQNAGKFEVVCDHRGRYVYVQALNKVSFSLCEVEVLRQTKNLIENGDFSGSESNGVGAFWSIDSKFAVTASIKSGNADDGFGILSGPHQVVTATSKLGFLLKHTYSVLPGHIYRLQVTYKSSNDVSSNTDAYSFLLPAATITTTKIVYFEAFEISYLQFFVEGVSETLEIDSVQLFFTDSINDANLDFSLNNFSPFQITSINVADVQGKPSCGNGYLRRMAANGMYESITEISPGEATEIIGGVASQWRIDAFSHQRDVCYMKIDILGRLKDPELRRCRDDCLTTGSSEYLQASCKMGCDISSRQMSMYTENRYFDVADCNNINDKWREMGVDTGNFEKACLEGMSRYSYVKELKCPSGQIINAIDFASYGTPLGECGKYKRASCHAKLTEAYTAKKCVGKPSCSFIASNVAFAEDPCPGVRKLLAVQASCISPSEALPRRQPYALTVAVTDPGLKVSTNEVVVYLEDVNEAPRFYSTSRYVDENSGNGVVVGRVLNATDDDDGDVVDYEITGGDGIANFAVNSLGQITVQCSVGNVLDFESKNIYTLLITASDMARKDKASLQTTQVVTVFLLDVNEPPSVQNTNFTVTEAALRGHEIGLVRSSDVDSVDIKLSYTLVGGDPKQQFRLGASSGILVLDQPIDYEDIESYVLSVTVRDLGKLSSSALVTVTVVNVNEAPYFPHATPLVRYVDEDGYGLPVSSERLVTGGKIVAKDDDADDEVNYKFISGRGDYKLNLFSITADGSIYTTKSAFIDFEEQGSYSLWVIAEDSAGLSSSMRVEILVNDINEPPNFYTSVFGVGENFNEGQFVGKIAANDTDLGNAQQLSYTILVGVFGHFQGLRCSCGSEVE
jgi:hypothetical protein